MKKILLVLALALGSLVAFVPPKKNVLIIGDSISIGYFPFVKEALSAGALVSHNPGNAQHTGNGLEKLDRWLAQGPYDVITFNWGLWDLCYRHPDADTHGNRDKVNGKITYKLPAYKRNLQKLVKRLKKTGAKLIFVTTTVVPPNEAGRVEGDELRYNEAAKQIMKRYNVEVLDLHPVSVDVHKRHKLADGDVHYQPEGYAELAQTVSGAIQKALNEIRH